MLCVPIDWIVDAPETFWLFGSGTPPWPSNRDWTANTVWLSMPEEEEEEEGGGTCNKAPLYSGHSVFSLKCENMNVVLSVKG